MMITSAASAGLYKWVDNDGNVHYSQKPPRNQQFKRLKAPPSGPENSKPLYNATTQKKSGNVAEAEAAKNEKIRATNCKNAKSNLKSYQLARRIRDKDGKVITLDDNERAKQIEKAKKDINQYCK
jgi:hypothetical protein